MNQEQLRELCSSSIRLDAITLNRTGSYFHPARLELRPLTILCGENGSGKSTWMKVLRFLRDVAHDEDFPFALSETHLPVVQRTPTFINATTIVLSELDLIAEHVSDCLSSHGYDNESTDSSIASASISLEATVLKTLEVPIDSQQVFGNGDGSLPGDLPLDRLNTAHAGDRILVEIELQNCTDEIGSEDADAVSYLSMHINATLVLSLAKRKSYLDLRDNSLGEHRTPTRVGRVETVECGLDYFRDSEAKDSIDARGYPSDEDINLCRYGIECIRRWLQEITRNVNVIFANRSCIDDSTVEEYDDFGKQMDEAVKMLSVGELGGSSTALARAFVVNNLLQSGDFSPQDTHDIVDSLVEDESYLTPNDLKLSTSERRNKILSWNALTRSRLDLSKLESETPKSLDDEEFLGVLKLIPGTPLVNYIPGYLVYDLDSYIKYWMESLLGARRVTTRHFKCPPCGFLLDRDNHAGMKVVQDRADYTQGTLEYRSPAGTMSSGFHHIFPVLVQTGVMWNGDTFMIESPEAHLHPTLQVKLTEYFLLHAETGRQFALETHSDLVVRRVLRSILEEEIRQDDVRIYFTRLGPVFTDEDLRNMPYYVSQSGRKALSEERSAYLDLIGINDKGQIMNWPPGFMDADIIESRRLMDAMYGDSEDLADE